MAKEKLQGNNFVLKVGGQPFGCATTGSLSITREFKEVTGCKEDVQQAGGASYKQRVPGVIDWSVSSGALYRYPTTAADATSLVTVAELHQRLLNGDRLDFELEADPDGTGGYNAKYSGKVYISESTLNYNVNEEAGADFSFVSDGALLITETNPT